MFCLQVVLSGGSTELAVTTEVSACTNAIRYTDRTVHCRHCMLLLDGCSTVPEYTGSI